MKYFTFSFISIIVFVFSYFNIGALAQTDEYGSMNCNRILSGLGLAASYVSVPGYSAFNQNDDGTLEMWIYPTASGGNPKTLISKGASVSGLSFSWMLSPSDGKMVFRIGTTDFLNTAGAAPPLNQWSHVAVSWSGGPNFTVKFYLNGAANGSAITQTATWGINSDQVRIGGSQASVSNFFQGDIDEVRFWSVEKTPEQIANNRFVGLGDGSNANSGAALTGSAYYAGLISSWTFNSTASAYDNISNYNGSYVGSAASVAQTLGVPVPYNLALKFGGNSTDNVRIPSNSAFNQYTNGTIELWFKPISFNSEQVLVCKGSTTSNISFILGVAASTGKLYFGTGTGIALNTTGAGLTINQWNHIAVTWNASGGNFDIKFFKNGKQNGQTSQILINFPFTSDPIWIGNSQPYNLPASGWIDELRFWDPALSESQIRTNMFTSCRGISSSSLIGAWNFDGNLLNFSSTTGINATFSNGGTNYCRFSAYVNESSTGAYSVNFSSHSTVINRTGIPNPFPLGYFSSYSFKTIPDNNTAGITDTVYISGINEGLTSVELFLDVQHTRVGDLTITLIAPNGQVRNVVLNNGSTGDNILSFFSDNFNYLPSSTTYFPPWGFLKPSQVFGNFSGSPVNGSWIIRCVDATAGETGVLYGWGVRINNLVGISNTEKEIPTTFNLYQNYPNPFNPYTNIKFDIPAKTGENMFYVKLTIYDMLGREIEVPVNREMQAGSYEIKWDGTNYSSGLYFYKLTAGVNTEVKKMMMIK
jgi:subtilisin-like proprotein convertase family protein